MTEKPLFVCINGDIEPENRGFQYKIVLLNMVTDL